MLACRPMLCFAASVMLGVALARFRPDCLPPPHIAWPAFFCLAVWFALTPRSPAAPPRLPDGYARHILPRPGWIARRGANRFVLIVSFGLLLAGMARQESWRHSLDRDRLPENRWFNAVMRAEAPVALVDDKNDRWRVPVRLAARDGEAVPEGIRLRLSAAKGPPLRRGDLVVARIRVRDARPRAYPGAFDYRFHLEREGLIADAYAVKPFGGGEPVVVVPVEDVAWHVRALRHMDAVRFAAIAATLRYGGDEGGMLATMLFGYRSRMAEDVRDAFRRVGIGHVLAISGLHVGLIVGLLWWCCGWLAWPRRWRALACLCLAVAYLGLSGGQVAAARATVMAAIHLAGIAWGRRGDMLNSLGAAAFLIVLANPTAPFDVGFQLSFTAVIFIYIALGRGSVRAAAARPLIGDSARRTRFLGYLRREIVSLTRLSVATWLGLYPIIAAVFNQVNLIGLPINIVVIPLMGAVLACGLLLPALGWIPCAAWLLTAPARLLTVVATRADAVPWSSFAAHAPHPAWVAVFYAFVTFYMLRGMVSDGKRRAAVAAFGLAGAALGLVGVTASMASLPPPAHGRLTHLPGSGFGTVVAESPSGDIALLGSMRRGGLDEADWLHHLRRSGPASVIAFGKATVVNMLPLTYHHRLRAFENIPLTRKADAGITTPWLPVPGAPGVEYAYCRDERGRAAALGVRSGGSSLCVVRHDVADVAALAAAMFADAAPDLLCTPFSGTEGEPWRGASLGATAALGKRGDALPPGWINRYGYGALLVDGGQVRGYDGSFWNVFAAPDDD